MHDIDVSVIIPTFHREAQLREAVHSVLAQSAVHVQVIVVDDSAEGTAREVIASLADSRVLYRQRPEPSQGRPALARNEGAGLARGRYLYFLDDDDMLKADALRLMSTALDAAPTAGMAFGAVEPFGEDPAVLRREQGYFERARGIARGLRGRRELGARLVFLSAILVNSACMVRRSAFVASGGYDAQISICEDAEFWGRIAYAHGYVFIDRPVVRYRTGAPSLMHDLAQNDARLRTSYRRIQHKYHRAHGLLNFLAMKIWTRAVLRRLDPPDLPPLAAGERS